MGFCTRRYFLLTICILQMISVVERQVFEFLGYMWIPILVNFFEIIFAIFGFFGAYQYRPKYIISYSVWHLFWLAWNIFIICLYLDIGLLNHEKLWVLKLDSQSESWWAKNGPGCKVKPEPESAEEVSGCLIHYRYIEILQASIQSVLAFLGVITGSCLSKMFLEEDDSSSRKSRKSPKRMSLYSIEFSPQRERQDSDSNDYDNDNLPAPVSPKPMTPRRVKRRSVMQRGSTSRPSTSSRRHNTARSSTRSSRRVAQNPVTRLMEQQQKFQQQQQHQIQQNPASPTDNSPNYFTSSNNNLMGPPQAWQSNGHTNPTYQQSSTQSLNEHDDFEDLYNNRPASVRSSYSNFHGTRAINYAQQHYHGHATPQVPQKRMTNPNRQSMRSIAFLNSGPPAYSSHGHIGNLGLDSETTI